MPPEIGLWMMHDAVALIPAEPLTDCDIELVKESLLQIIDSTDRQKVQTFAAALFDYINACNETFAASVRINLILLVNLLAVFLITIIAILLTPITITSIILLSLLAVSLFTVNIAKLCIEQNSYTQREQRDRLKKYCDQSYSSSINFFSNPKNKTIKLTVLNAPIPSVITEENISEDTTHSLSLAPSL